MKTIEEKAKAYDEAIERAKQQLEGAKVFDYDNEQIAHDIRTTVYNIFPELKESEDEQTRKALISFLKSPFVNENITDEKVAPWIAWLEKQGEQKSFDYENANIQQNPAWSEEDEKRAERLLGWLDTLDNYIHHDAIVSLDLRRERMQQVEQLKTWLESLKDRYTWKPSDEQMIALRQVISGCSYDIEPLVKLETKLKEL